jgi:hypothetical protein
MNHSGYQLVDQLGERSIGDDEEADEKKKKEHCIYLWEKTSFNDLIFGQLRLSLNVSVAKRNCGRHESFNSCS